MALTEFQAQQVMLVRAMEQARDTGGLWSAGDAKEATRVTTELLGRTTPFDQFAFRRAEWALEEVGRRQSNATVDLRSPRWPIVAGWLLIFVAIATGLVTDYLAASHRVDIVEYPLVVLILWNLGIYLWTATGWISKLLTWKWSQGGLLLDMFGKWRLHGAFSTSTGNGMPWMDQFKNEWSSLAANLNHARLSLVFHLAAVAFTLGVILSLCFRALFKGYLACWDTSFVEVSAETIHSVVRIVLAPGALLLNRPVPDTQHIAGLHCQNTNGELAGPWILLYAASILVWIILPRLLLATAAGITRWRLQRSFPLPLKSTYFTALRAIWGGHAVGVLAIPFRYELTPQIKSNLTRLLERVHGLAVTIAVQQPVLMGDDTQDWKAALGSERHIAVFVIFNLAATAEPDAHGRLLQRVLTTVAGRIPVIPVVDVSTYGDVDHDRFRQRCHQWRKVLDEVQCKPLFINLMTPDDDQVLLSLGARLNDHD